MGRFDNYQIRQIGSRQQREEEREAQEAATQARFAALEQELA